MGNCFTCLKPPSSSASSSSSSNDTNQSAHVLSNQPISEKIKCRETEELLQTTNLVHNLKKSHYSDSSSSNFKKSLLVNGGTGGKNSNSLIDEKLIQSSAKESQIADNAINKLFEEYKDDTCEDAILSEGIERLCQDLNYSPDDFPILVLAFCLEATQMCRFTKLEFIHGLKKLNATTIPELRLRLIQKVEKLETDGDLFKQLYRFTFNFGLDDGSRILSLDMAMSLWKLVFTVHSPADDLLERWLNFLSKEKIRGIQRDTWLMFQNFAECFDIESYDSDEAWPSLFDDFVDYERLKKLESKIEDNDEDMHNNNNNNNNNNFSQKDNEQNRQM